jgi:hypothetical protein
MRMLDAEQQVPRRNYSLSNPGSGRALLMMVALHGNNTNAAIIKEYWQHLAPSAGAWLFRIFMVAATGVYVGTTFRGQKRIEGTFHAMTRKSARIPSTIISGFSKGGNAAWWLLSSRFFPSRILCVSRIS